MDNILSLHRDLKDKTYRHGSYEHFRINDPKPRDIHKASVRDRLLHHALYRQLYPFFDRIFIPDSYSCRLRKGTHRALNRFRSFAYKESQNYTRTLWVLTCDIRKFFASIDQQILLNILSRYVADPTILWLIGEVVRSFCSCSSHQRSHNPIHLISTAVEIRCICKGLPLGNLMSQLLVNIYMNEFDQCVKHRLKAKYYIRYADDFVILSHDKEWIAALIPRIAEFLESSLGLSLHPDKVFIKTLASGVDFLGWVHFPDHRVMRTTTKKRMFWRLKETEWAEETVGSYLGLLRHGNARRLQKAILDVSKP